MKISDFPKKTSMQKGLWKWWFLIFGVIIGGLFWPCDGCGGDGRMWLGNECGECKGSGKMIVKLITFGF